MNKKALALVLLVVVLPGCLAGCSARDSTRAESNRNETAAVQPTSASARPASSVGFASRQKLLEHYNKHGAEFGNVSIEDYLRAAQTLRDQALGTKIIEAVRTDGVITRFDRDTGTFIAFTRDRVIRTCFKPNDGEAYFRRQVKRR